MDVVLETMELSAGQQLDVGRAMVRAADEALGKPPEDGKDMEQEVVRRVLRALAAAQDTQENEIARLIGGRHGVSVVIDTEPLDAVSTAFWLWTGNTDVEIDEVYPVCVGGLLQRAFARALIAAETFRLAHEYLNDDASLAFVSIDQPVLAEVNASDPPTAKQRAPQP